MNHTSGAVRDAGRANDNWRGRGEMAEPTLARRQMVAQERSYEEIATTLDCPLGTVRSRVHRARVMLQRNLKVSQVSEA